MNTLFELISAGEAKFKEGFGPPPSFENVALIKGPAEKNYAAAQLNLAAQLEQRARASGPNPNLAEAISWYRKAAANGDARAKEALERLNVSEAE
jgi:TPR repeat protein